MDRETLSAALKVLKGCYYGKCAVERGIERVKQNALAEDQGMAIDDLARRVADRQLGRTPSVEW